jgi:hypothetical protein
MSDKECSRCHAIKLIDKFQKGDKILKMCEECRNREQKHNIKKKDKFQNTPLYIDYTASFRIKLCSRCILYKNIISYIDEKSNKEFSNCIACRQKRFKDDRNTIGTQRNNLINFYIQSKKNK